MLKKHEIIEGLRRIGLTSGDTVLVHSAMRTFGLINNGASTIVEALLEVLEHNGTLVVPTFTFKHEVEADPIIDLLTDPSEMGAITEEVRNLPEAMRSIAYRHSFAAVGPNAPTITRIDPEICVFDLRSSFGKMLNLNSKVLILGLTYECSTSHHFAEYICQVPYRQVIPLVVSVKQPDGSLIKQPVTDYQPKPGDDGKYYSRAPDFNKLGRILEIGGMVNVTSIGNAIVRVFNMRDLVDLAKVKAALDYNVFRVDDEGPTFLADGEIVESPMMVDGAGRPGKSSWCVVDPERIFFREKSGLN